MLFTYITLKLLFTGKRAGSDRSSGRDSSSGRKSH